MIHVQRSTGSYYTPDVISEFIVGRISKKLRGKKINILEPSAGSGAFIRPIYLNNSLKKRILGTLAIELNKKEADKVKKVTSCSTLNVKAVDFLNYQKKFKSNTFDLIIGNPPYIKKGLLSPRQIELCQEIHSIFPQLSRSGIKNIWSAFLVRSISLLNDNGILAFVLPAELLQVNFTSELRNLLVNEFQRVEIFTFNELLFKECKGQDTIILIAEKNSAESGLFFHNVINVSELEKEDFDFVGRDFCENDKWTSHCLSYEEVLLLNRLKKNFQTMDNLCVSRAGIVTGANDFFILNEEDTKSYGLRKYSKPIVQKGAFVKGWIEFNENNYKEIYEKNKPSLLIDLNNHKLNSLSRLEKYFEFGKSRKIHERYKTQSRNYWYQVPGIGVCSPALFFKRGHEMPKFVLNHAQVLATDSAYLVNPKEGIDIKSLVLSFYNSLTLIFSELNGRFYGGGVLELTPNEFRSLPIPYMKISEKKYLQFLKLFNSGIDYHLVIRQLDDFILRKTIPDITDIEINALNVIRKKLVARRKRL